MIQPCAAQGAGEAVAALPVAGDAGGELRRGRELFADLSCGACHTLADAGAIGYSGPSLDGDADMTEARVVDRVTYGKDMMPGLGDQLSKAEISAIASYVVKAGKK